jgi:hypothetical protein
MLPVFWQGELGRVRIQMLLARGSISPVCVGWSVYECIGSGYGRGIIIRVVPEYLEAQLHRLDQHLRHDGDGLQLELAGQRHDTQPALELLVQALLDLLALVSVPQDQALQLVVVGHVCVVLGQRVLRRLRFANTASDLVSPRQPLVHPQCQLAIQTRLASVRLLYASGSLFTLPEVIKTFSSPL